MAAEMKTDMTTYEYHPETISRVTPHPNYPDRAIPDQYWKWKQKSMAKQTLERFRTPALTKRILEKKAFQGRYYAHVKLDQIRTEVQRIHDTESNRRKPKNRNVNPLKLIKPQIDDQMKLPKGITRYDYVIKERADKIEQIKTTNNRKMDELVEKLGYMDYRDALAVHKYMLEAKRSKEYEQVARAKVLDAAYKRIDQARLQEIEEKALQKAAKKIGKKMEEDPSS